MKIEVSNGEIVDKYTILILKSENCVQGSDKHTNIKRELDAVSESVVSLGVDDSLVDELLDVNRQLWEIEDRLRVMESEKSFSTEFITLARLVYKTNDNRFRIKSQVNETTSSNLREEKILPAYKGI